MTRNIGTASGTILQRHGHPFHRLEQNSDVQPTQSWNPYRADGVNGVSRCCGESA